MEKLYTVSKNRPGANCGSCRELLIAKFRLKLKKVGKTTSPFRYDLNQIPYDYTVEIQAITSYNMICHPDCAELVLFPDGLPLEKGVGQWAQFGGLSGVP